MSHGYESLLIQFGNRTAQTLTKELGFLVRICRRYFYSSPYTKIPPCIADYLATRWLFGNCASADRTIVGRLTRPMHFTLEFELSFEHESKQCEWLSDPFLHHMRVISFKEGQSRFSFADPFTDPRIYPNSHHPPLGSSLAFFRPGRWWVRFRRPRTVGYALTHLTATRIDF